MTVAHVLPAAEPVGTRRRDIPTEIRAALFGFGNVGSAIARLAERQPWTTGSTIRIVGALVNVVQAPVQAVEIEVDVFAVRGVTTAAQPSAVLSI